MSLLSSKLPNIFTSQKESQSSYKIPKDLQDCITSTYHSIYPTNLQYISTTMAYFILSIPVSLALAGRFTTTKPTGKLCTEFFTGTALTHNNNLGRIYSSTLLSVSKMFHHFLLRLSVTIHNFNVLVISYIPILSL